MVINSAQRNDDVFAGRARRQRAFQHHLNGSRNLPPEISSCPRRGRVGAHDRRTNRSQRTIHIRVRVRGHHKRSGHNISALHHDLVADARTRGIEINAMIFREALDGLVLVQVRIVLVLDVVVEGKHQLLGILNLLRSNGLKLLHHRRSIVMRHHAMRTDGDEVAGAQRPLRPFGKMRLRDFFNDGLTHPSLPIFPTCHPERSRRTPII